MTVDVRALRAQFPSLESGIAHFDGPGGTQTPRPVADAVAAALCGPLSNRGNGVRSERNATLFVEAFRAAYADLLAASPLGIVHGRSATQLTLDFSRHLAKTWEPGDEVVVSRLDHDANVRPWIQAAQRVGATVRWAEFDPATAELDLARLADTVGPRTKLVAVTAASNLLGTMPPVAQIAQLVHDQGALLYVDGVHYAAHHAVDIRDLGADFFVCSPYKFLGPHCGVLAADPALLETLKPDKLLPSTNAVPERFEFGTLPYEQLAGATAAVDFLAGIAPGPGRTRRQQLLNTMAALAAHEDTLRKLVEEGLAGLGSAVTLHSRAELRTPTLLVTLPGRRTWDAYEHLAEANVLAPAGSFYAIEPFRALKLDDEHALRIGLAPYNDADEVGRLIDGLTEFLAS